MAVHSTGHIPQKITNALQKASVVTGVDFQYLMDTAARESGFRPSVKAPTSSASGLFQFIESTWLQMVKEHGNEFGLGEQAKQISKTKSGKYVVEDAGKRREILDLRNNPDVASVMAGAFTKLNAQHMEQTLSRKPTSGELYIAHFLGAGNGGKLVKAANVNPTMKAADLFPSAARSNKSLFYQRGKAVSVKGLYQNLVRRHNVGKINGADLKNVQNQKQLDANVAINKKAAGVDASFSNEAYPPQQNLTQNRVDAQKNVETMQKKLSPSLNNSLFQAVGFFNSPPTSKTNVTPFQKIAGTETRGTTKQGQIGVWGQRAILDQGYQGNRVQNETPAAGSAHPPTKRGPILETVKDNQEKAPKLFLKGGLFIKGSVPTTKI